MNTIDRNSLVDIKSITINTALPKEERMHDFIRQIKNPYMYRHGKYIVKIAFSDTDITLEERLTDYVRAKCAAG